jgi:hypothetical protein
MLNADLFAEWMNGNRTKAISTVRQNVKDAISLTHDIGRIPDPKERRKQMREYLVVLEVVLPASVFLP